jgi:hypothetical protein
MKISRKWTRALAFAWMASVLAACGGGGDSTPASTASTTTGSSQAQTFGSANLVSGVYVLSDSQNAALLSQTATQLVYQGQLALPVGTVVVGDTLAFKVAAIDNSGTATTITYTAPAIEEVFDSVQVSGTFTADPAAFQPNAAVNASARNRAQVVPSDRDSVTKSGSIDTSQTLPVGSSSITNSLSTTLTAKLSYDYQASNGGLQSASLDITGTQTLSSLFNLTQSVNASGSQLLGTIPIPVPIAINSLGHLIGVRLIDINVPVYAKGAASLVFQLSYGVTYSYSESMSLAYDPVNNVTMTPPTFTSVTASFNSYTPTAPSGVPSLESFDGSASLGLELKPEVDFLNSFVMMGLDATATASDKVSLLVVPVAPPYCLTVAPPSVDFTLGGYIVLNKGSQKAANLYSTNLYTGTQTQLGSCNYPTLVIDTQNAVMINGVSLGLLFHSTDTQGHVTSNPGNLQWSSSDSSLATVDSDGVVTTPAGLPTSTNSPVTITATDPVSGASTSTTVTVQGWGAAPGSVSSGGLTWYAPGVRVDWTTANALCTTAQHLGTPGWRLPTLDELTAFYEAAAPAVPGGPVILMAGLYRPSDYTSYWTSTTGANTPFHYLIDFSLVSYDSNVGRATTVGVTDASPAIAMCVR